MSSHRPAPFLPSQPCVPLCFSLSFPFCSVSHPLPLPLFQIPQEQARVCFLHLLRRAPEVQLMVQSSWLRDSLSKQTDMQGVNLLFSSRRGHLFLQTDQPVYNPGQRGESRRQGLHLSYLLSHLSEITRSPSQEGCFANICSPSLHFLGGGQGSRAHPPVAPAHLLILHFQFATESLLWIRRCARPLTSSRSWWR